MTIVFDKEKINKKCSIIAWSCIGRYEKIRLIIFKYVCDNPILIYACFQYIYLMYMI